MFKEMHHMDRSFRAMDLAEKMAERRGHSLAATPASSVTLLARMPFAPTGMRETRKRVPKSTQAVGRA